MSLVLDGGFASAIRRRRIDRAYRDISLTDFAALAVTMGSETDGHAGSAALMLADRHDLTIYDAADLDLALRLRLLFATLDQALRRAGRAAGLSSLGAAA